MRSPTALLLLTPLVFVGALACQPSSPNEAMPAAGTASPTELPGSAFNGPAWEFEEVVPGVYHARGTGALSVGSNGVVIVNDDDVLLVDSHVSPVAAAAIVDEVEALTDKPVRYVVNTHYHFDHAHGNQIYGPEVHVIGHEVTREHLEDGTSLRRAYGLFVGSLPDQIAQLQEQLAATTTEAERSQITSRIAYLENYQAGQEGLVPTAPNTTLSQRMTLFRGDREIQILFFGRGHTGGDVVVYLPEERLLATGDLLLPGLPFMGEGFIDEWDETLEALKSLDIAWVLPGHGRPFDDMQRITYQQEYMRDVFERARVLHQAGLSVEEAAARIDMTDHAHAYPNITGPGAPQITILRIFELLEGATGAP